MRVGSKYWRTLATRTAAMFRGERSAGLSAPRHEKAHDFERARGNPRQPAADRSSIIP
jgi:hypothetical protein